MSNRHHKSSRSDDRRHSSHSSSYSSRSSKYEDFERSGSSKEETRHVFNYEKHKYVLNKMFFLDNEVLKVGTKEYEEFWTFLRRYQSTEEKAIQMNKQKHYYESIERKLTDLAFKMPDQWSDISELMAKTSSVNDLEDRYYVRNSLSAERVLQFRNIIVLYLDFLDKQKQRALEKLRELQMDLPIFRFKDQILDAIQRHSVVLIAGDTGCGKSTQVPQYLLNAGYENICCSQPRRIACISLRKRVAFETQNEFGTQIGYQIRFEKSKSKNTKMLFLTEGLLLRQVSTDPMLTNYNVIILDEVHERHLSCDFLLGVMKCLIHQRKSDLKVILMSATINIKLFSEYFGNCPIIEVPGRLHPIELKYYPIPKTKFGSEKSSKIDCSPYLRILQLIDDKFGSEERGDLLVFLSGLSEINSVSDLLKQYAQQSQKWIILHLHSSLSIAEQDKVFDIAPEGIRKCILSTNIAETSLTIDGIRFVCDSGKVKEMSYDSNCRMQRLQEFWISIASAEQRKGRAGRTGPGICYRLYSEDDFKSFKAHTSPEIRRVPLHSLLLSMISMGLPDARKFPFIEPPTLKSVNESLQSLKEQTALTENEELTPMGRMLARLPVDITIGKMLILSSVFDITEPILSLAAALSVQTPITNQSLHDKKAIDSRRSLQSADGDPFTLLNLYNKWLEIKSEEQNSKKWCKTRGLEEQRFYEMTKLRQQFKDILKDAGLFYQSDDTTHMSSSDRIRRHGEVKLLRKMKREFDRKAPKRRKLLKVDGSGDEDSDENEFDAKDIDFRLSHDKRQVEALRDGSKQYSNRDITLMKLILCNGLHPQLAVADEHNSYKTDSDQMFHTKDKPFAVLHPNSVFALEPDLLKVSQHSEEQIKGFHSFGPLSNSHQLIAYVSLLETTKPYLCNCVRIPASHVLLLVSNSIDTNYDFSRIVCDSWLELQFPDTECSQKFISQALRVRDLWLQLLHRLFNECFDTTDEDNDRSRSRSPEVRQMQTQLVKDIHSFIGTQIKFSLRRLLKADIKHLYVGQSAQQLSLTTDLMRNKLFSDCAQQLNQYRVHPIKGGLEIRPYLTYNCLSANESLETLKYLKKSWICDLCGKELSSTPLERIRHKESCKPKEVVIKSQTKVEAQDMDESKPSTSEAYDPLKIPYFCDECQQKLFLTSTQILRHKRSHHLSSSESKTTTDSIDSKIVIKSEEIVE